MQRRLLVFLLACHCGARGSLDEPTFSTVGPALPPTVEQYLEAYPEAYCARYAACCARAGGSFEQCVQAQRQRARSAADDPDLVFDPTRALACLDALRGWSGDYDLCTLAPLDQFASCTHTFTETPELRHAGESCLTDADCDAPSVLHPRCLHDPDAGFAYCHGVTHLDDKDRPFFPCHTGGPGIHASVDICTDFGLVCSSLRDQCGPAQTVLGDSCDRFPGCSDGFSCSNEGHCVATLTVGAACDDAGPPCAPDLFCAQGHCTPRPAPGEPCIHAWPECARDSQCIEGVCRAVHRDIPYVCGISLP